MFNSFGAIIPGTAAKRSLATSANLAFSSSAKSAVENCLLATKKSRKWFLNWTKSLLYYIMPLANRSTSPADMFGNEPANNVATWSLIKCALEEY